MFNWTTGLCSSIAILILLFILSTLWTKGLSHLDIQFITKPSYGSGLEGGILYQIVGTCILLLVTCIIVLPCATSFAVFYTSLLPPGRFKNFLRPLLHILNATPSILFGIIGYLFFVKICAWNKSWLAGSFTLALMILPTVTISLIHRIQSIPKSYVEGALGLGFNEETMLRAVILPYSWGGLWTGVVMGLARAAGETAPIMFTAVVFSGASIPDGVVNNPVLALPYHIFNLTQDMFGEKAMAAAWASSFILVVCVFIISAFAIPMRIKSHEEAKK